MKRMNFRQRIAWLLLAIFLAITCAFLYYIFEISDAFNKLAIDHVEHFHKIIQTRGGKLAPKQNNEEVNIESNWRFWNHLADIPLPVWILLSLLPYLQTFTMLLACTKPDPQFSMAFMWPLYIYIRLKKWLSGSPQHNLKPTNCPEPNGHVLIET